MNSLTIDVEEWYHILGSDTTPSMDRWVVMEARLDRNMGRILDLLAAFGIKATFFWLGWAAERYKPLVLRCLDEGHEVASHGYAHLLPYKVGQKEFTRDITRAKAVLEDITGTRVLGFRAAGFGVLNTTPWALEVIRATGHSYDSSVFPAKRAHGGIATAPLIPHLIATRSGELFEIPVSVLEVLGQRVGLFGGGYLRLASKQMLRWGTTRLKTKGRPLVVYFHPRDIDPDQPRLPLPFIRRFKYYVNLHTTFAKVKWLCENYHFGTMHDLMNAHMGQSLVGLPPGRPSIQISSRAAFGEASG
jgi:polysaccharide deacetylase family protein (PEP-CTERM system associated)